MSFSKLFKKPLQPGDKFKLIGEDYNPAWKGLVEYIGTNYIKMIKPDDVSSYVEIGQTSICSGLQVEYEGINWIRYNDKPKKNYQPSWL